MGAKISLAPPVRLGATALDPGGGIGFLIEVVCVYTSRYAAAKSGSIVVKISEEQFHFCELAQASTRLPPTSAQVLGEMREQTL